jgi:hypothetical protein
MTVDDSFPVSGARLEARYRRLLRAYPASYRAAREDEIVGVLMDGAAPGQRRPSVAAAADLVRGGLVTRLRAGRPAYAPTPWRDAVAVATVLLPVLLAARVLRPAGMLLALTTGEAWDWRQHADQLFQGWQGPVLWTLALCSLFVRVRRVPAVFATLAVAMEVVLVVQLAGRSSAYLVERQVTILAVELVACALLWRASYVERGVALVGRSSLGRLALAAGLVDASTSYSYGLLHGTARSVPSLLVALVLLLSVVWSGRARLRPVSLRLAAPAVVLLVVAEVGDQLGRKARFSDGGAKVLALQFALSLGAGAVVALSTAAAVILSRRWGIELRLVRRSSS